MRPSDPDRDVLLFLGAAATLAVPFLLTQAVITGAPGEVPISRNPTPHGYTVSLLFFVLPVLVTGWWHLRHPRHPVDRKAFIAASGLMAAAGFVLDLAFAYSFFEFPNPGAALGIRLPAWAFCLPGSDPCRMGFVAGYIPIEDTAFYIFGGLFMVSTYVWCDLNWVPAYEPEHYRLRAREVERLLRPSPHVLALTALLVAGAFAVKRAADPVHGQEIPGYFLFLLAGGFFPTFLMYRVVKRFVNWRAFASAFTVLVFVSLIWEATLALPYGWWGYKPEYMLGIFYQAWWDIPLEAVLLWLVGAWDAILLYELIRVWLHMERAPSAALFGGRDAPGTGS